MFIMMKFVIVFIVLLVFFISIPYLIVNINQKRISLNIETVVNHEFAIVFGAGIKSDSSPSDALKDRLIATAELYKAEKIKKILVSGDNRFANYNEPKAMKEYLINTEKIPESSIVMDFAGRRTYDTCVRAKEIWGIDKAILISQGFHLPRAIFICNSLGIESYGFSASRQVYRREFYYKLREFFAIYKTIIDLYIWTPDYISGKKEVV